MMEEASWTEIETETGIDELLAAARAWRDGGFVHDQALADLDRILGALQAAPFAGHDAVDALADTQDEDERDVSARLTALRRWRDAHAPLPYSQALSHLPRRRWLLKDWLPHNRAGVFTGRGGLGKSQIALALACGVAGLTDDWLGGVRFDQGAMRPTLERDGRGPVVYATWEDDLAEVSWRLAARFNGIAHPTPDLLIVDMSTVGPVWAPVSETGHISTRSDLTSAGAKLRELCESVGARLLICDPLAAAYMSDENARGLVRAFMSSWDGWARENECAVMWVSHPSKGAPDTPSGSTDWEGAARFVWVLTELPHYTDEKNPAKSCAVAGERMLMLEGPKGNYGRRPQGVVVEIESVAVLDEDGHPDWIGAVRERSPCEGCAEARGDTPNASAAPAGQKTEEPEKPKATQGALGR